MRFGTREIRALAACAAQAIAAIMKILPRIIAALVLMSVAPAYAIVAGTLSVHKVKNS